MSPSIRDAFRHHHKLTEAERVSLWDTCTFALDANVLLNIYRYADSTREDLFKVLQGLSSRVWVPFQAAREFYQHRIQVIQEQREKYSELHEALERSLSTLRSGSFRKSAFLRIDEIEQVLRPAIENAKKVVAEQSEQHPNLIHDDQYLESLVEIIGSGLGDEPDQEKYDKRCADAQARIDRQQPPGFRDAKKPAPERYGDVLIWYELLDRAEATQKPVVFVTDDDKEDWWQIVGGQKLGPRPELREEMRKRAGVDFYIYNPAFLLQTAGQQLNLAVAKSSVDDAAKVAEELQERLREIVQSVARPEVTVRGERPHSHAGRWVNDFGRAGDDAVYLWLIGKYLSGTVVPMERGPFDFVVHDSVGTVAIEVKVFRQSSTPAVRMRVRDSCVRAFYHLSKGIADDFHLYLVGPDADTGWELARVVLGGAPPDPPYTICVGFIGSDGVFAELGRESWGLYG